MNTDKLKLLFVDDEPMILDGLRRQLSSHRREWDMRFAQSGDEALTILRDEPFDIIVSDMRMPGMTGGQLLQKVLLRYPYMARMILSGQTDQNDLMRDIGAIHQYLQKPCDPAVLCSAIERTFRLFRQLRQPQLRLTTNRVTALPPASDTFRSLVNELTRDDASVTVVAKIVADDPALSVKLMQLVNSAFFGLPRKISTPQDAVVLLGLKTVHAIVIASHLFDFLGEGHPLRADINQLWETSVQIGERAANIAKADGCSLEVQKHCRLAGMLALVGRAILYIANPERYRMVIQAVHHKGLSLVAAETQQFGATQDEVSAYAVGIWGFSDELVETLLYQRNPSEMPHFTPKHPLSYLHLARGLQELTFLGATEQQQFDLAFVERCGLAGLIEQCRRQVA